MNVLCSAVRTHDGMNVLCSAVRTHDGMNVLCSAVRTHDGMNALCSAVFVVQLQLHVTLLGVRQSIATHRSEAVNSDAPQ
jgi:hypothetical protein